MGSTLIQGLGFVLVVLACTANDSLQTLGTFLVSNRGRTPLWLQVLWICLATAAILIFGWIRYHGDPAWDRLGSFPPPDAFSWFYLIPPLTIAALTWWGAPIGTSILVLSAFAPMQTTALVKTSALGYLFSLVISLLLYGLGLWLLEQRFSRSNKPASTTLPKRWIVLQWLSTAWLWCQWMIQNAASLYVYLPRRLSLAELFLSIAVICAALALIFAWGGGPIQSIIRRKINIHDIRSATLIDLVFGMILFTRALSMSMIPLSTTWVFLGLLAGRELALVARLHQSSPGHAIKQLVRDLFKASVGVGVSIAVASSLQLVLM